MQQVCAILKKAYALLSALLSKACAAQGRDVLRNPLQCTQAHSSRDMQLACSAHFCAHLYLPPFSPLPLSCVFPLLDVNMTTSLEDANRLAAKLHEPKAALKAAHQQCMSSRSAQREKSS